MMNGQGNAVLLYGTDSVTIALRKEERIKKYFKEDTPEITVVESPGSFEAFQNALGGESLFTSSLAVVLDNPFFLKRSPTTKKEEKAWKSFLDTIKQLSSDIFLVILSDGKWDQRLKTAKELHAVVDTEECNLLEPKNGAMVMVRMLMDRGKQISPDARAYLEDVLGSWSTLSRPLLETECDKIILMAEHNPIISKRLLEYALPEYMNQGIFKFTDALLHKKADVVLSSVDRVFTDVTETLKNIGFLASRFRKIKIYYEMKRNGKGEEEIRKALEMRNSWGFQNFKKDIHGVTEDDAEWFLVHLFEYQLKTREGSSDTLKDLLLMFCLRK